MVNEFKIKSVQESFWGIRENMRNPNSKILLLVMDFRPIIST